MPVVGNILWVILWCFSALLWVRFILEWVQQIAPQWRPRGVVLLVAEATYTVTDPPLRFLRRFIKPIRIGAVAIDLSWTLLLFAVYIAMSWVV
jgi:YggT family protein